MRFEIDYGDRKHLVIGPIDSRGRIRNPDVLRQRNIGITDAGYPHYKDRAKLIAVAKEGRQQFEEQMARERAQRRERSGQGWEQGKEP